MRKINGQRVDAVTDISDTSGGEALKWDASTSKMVWELQDGTSYVPAWSGERGVIGGGGGGPGSASSETIEYITIASTGNSTDFGNLVSRGAYKASCSNGSRGIWAGEEQSGESNEIDYVTISTPSDATDFGDLTRATKRAGAASDGTIGKHCSVQLLILGDAATQFVRMRARGPESTSA